MNMHRKTSFVLCTGLLFCAIFAFCTVAQAGSDVVLIKNYSPKFKADLSAYKDTRIYLMNFDNQARDTSMWSYFSPDKKFSYSGTSWIHNYFWYSFEKALIGLGMFVSNKDRPDPYAPAVWMTLKSVTDARFVVEVNIQKYVYGTLLTKVYAVTGEDVKPEERKLEYLEKRAYEMTDKLFEMILTDPEFKNAFLKSAAEMVQAQVK